MNLRTKERLGMIERNETISSLAAVEKRNQISDWLFSLGWRKNFLLILVHAFDSVGVPGIEGDIAP